jgi:Domain of unknown function (DUF3846)
MKALMIPVEGPIKEVDLKGGLDELQQLVGGGLIEAINLPEFVDQTGMSTAYVNEEGKYLFEPNMRANDFMVPGVGLFPGDYIAGPFLLCGFDPMRGEHAELPKSIIDRARLIEREAA